MLKIIDLNKVNQHIKKAFTSDENFSKMKFSQNYVSSYAKLQKLAFFMSETCLNSQFKHTNSVIPTIAHYSQGNNTIIYYDGATSQNKAFSQICGAVANIAESEPHRPNLGHILNQNMLGAFIMLKTYLLNSFYVFVSLIATSVFVLVVWFLLIVILGA